MQAKEGRIFTAFDSDAWLKDQLGVLVVRSKKSIDYLAKVSGMSRASFYNRLKSPEDFSLKELRLIESVARRYNMSVLVEV